MKNKNSIKAYKVFNPDFTCMGFKYEEGKTYEMKEKPSLCNVGFHACVNPVKCFDYYKFDPNNIVCEVELVGDVVGGEDDKMATNKITIVKRIAWSDLLSLVNTGIGNTGLSNSGYSNSGDSNSGDRNSGYSNSGYSNSGDRNSGYSNSGDRNSGDRNSGYSNSGDRNSGDSNSGDRNSGYSNSGDRNSGDFNSCDYESGHFNSVQSDTIRVFNKDLKRDIWDNSNIPDYFYFDLCEWIGFDDMTDDEKKEYPNAFVCDGYLKAYEYKEAWANAFKNASKEEIEITRNLPNFDAQVFYDITGIDYFLKNK